MGYLITEQMEILYVKSLLQVMEITLEGLLEQTQEKTEQIDIAQPKFRANTGAYIS